MKMRPDCTRCRGLWTYTYAEPFHVARQFRTVALMTEGHAAWNVVTSMNDGEALNMGHDAHSGRACCGHRAKGDGMAGSAIGSLSLI